MEWIADPTVWAGLATLIAIEIVLGIDNLVFIAILADKLPPEQRDRARILGLSLALGMRLVLLASISWMVTLTQPLFEVLGKPVSGRDLIFLIGGLFLLFKATKELHERLEGGQSHHHEGPRVYAGFGAVIAQIVVLDAVFSIDSVITAVGMVQHIEVMMIAVIIAVLVMMVSSKPLTRFVSAHPTVIVLCLGFLMMIGFSLIAEGVEFHIPKGYLYAAIGFSILVEAFNQTARAKRNRGLRGLSMRERTAEAVLRLISGKVAEAPVSEDIEGMVASEEEKPLFDREEMQLLQRVMKLDNLDVSSVMTHRKDIIWIEVGETRDSILQKVREHRHSRYPLCTDSIDNPVGIIVVKDLLLHAGEANLTKFAHSIVALPESTSILDALKHFRTSTSGFAMVLDEYGGLQGIVTLKDVMEAIVGSLPEPEYRQDYTGVKREDGSWLLDGGLAVHEVEEMLGVPHMIGEGDFNTLAGFMLFHLGRIPKEKDSFVWNHHAFIVKEMDRNRIDKVLVKLHQSPE